MRMPGAVVPPLLVRSGEITEHDLSRCPRSGLCNLGVTLKQFFLLLSHCWHVGDHKQERYRTPPIQCTLGSRGFLLEQ